MEDATKVSMSMVFFNSQSLTDAMAWLQSATRRLSPASARIITP